MAMVFVHLEPKNLEVEDKIKMGFKYFHIATKEWFTNQEMEAYLDRGFDFKCNECGKSIGEHLKVLADGIFCVNCFNKIMGEIEK